VQTREVAVYAKWGEAMQITDGRYNPASVAALAGGETGRCSGISPHPPAFLKPRGLGAWDGARGRYGPVDLRAGEQRSALYDLADDDGQERNRIEALPEETARLRQGLRDFLGDLDAPAEQVERLGL